MHPMAAAASQGFEAAAFDVPRVFGRLVLLKLIARGGMGDVYLAATTGIEGAERPCVVKTIRRDHIHDGSFLARFLDEARVQSQLHHPGVAQVVEASTDEQGEPYSVVEYVEGRSLADVRQRAIQSGARIGWPEAVAIAIEMANALAHVHERAGADGTPLGIVHRDLSPQNVMVGYAGEVKLIDFGTARGHNRRCHTVAGVVFAKPGYVAPEVARQQVGDGRIDVYALGIMLWELCAGRRYLTGDPQKHLEDAAAGKLVVPPIAGDVGAPALLDKVIDKLTQSDPDERYATASLAAADLGRVLAAAPAGKNGERSVRGRVGTLMHALWPKEPARSRADFVKLLKDARALRPKEVRTPAAPEVAQKVAEHMHEEGGVLAGTSYRLLEKIGEGASGAVWSAEHMELGRRVAIKVLAPEHASATDAIERFRREARAVAALSHENLVALYDFGKAQDGRVFLAMELLDGRPLDRVVKSRRLGWRKSVELAIQAARALEAAHGAGLVHRDLKPANLFLTRQGTVKLLDFGVAMALSDTADSVDGPSTRAGAEPRARRQKGFAIFGTPEYMAPEQVTGEPVDARCDVYALGCVLYEMLTGQRPFRGKSSVEVLGKQVREAPMPPRERAADRDIPEAVEDVVLRAMMKAREERYASAKEMRRALEEALVVPVAPPPPRFVWSKRLVALSLTAGAVALVSHVGLASAPKPPGLAREADGMAALPGGDTRVAPAVTQVAVAPAPNDGSGAGKASAGQGGRERLDAARAAARAHPGDVRALQEWAAAALEAGELREARSATEAWSLRDGSPAPKLFLATIYEAAGRAADARATLEEVLQAHPESDVARRMLAGLGVALPPPPTGVRKSEVAHR